MKTIKNSKSFRVYTFTSVLMLILLFSLMIGTAVEAKPGKPDKPGKPPADLKMGDFKIWIGERSGTQHIILNSPDYLYVENEVEGYWLPPRKGKTREGWGVGLGPEGDVCGTYTIAPVLGGPGYEDVVLTEVLVDYGIDTELEVYRFNIFHVTQTHPQMGEGDYWRIRLQWEVGRLEIPNDPNPPIIISHFLILSGNTSTDTEWEGIYNENDDTWTVYFDDAWFQLEESNESGESVELWTGQLSFTVKIERTLVES